MEAAVGDEHEHDQPPYLEVFRYAPLMLVTICDANGVGINPCGSDSGAVLQPPPSPAMQPHEWLMYLHQVHCAIDEVAAAHGMYKAKAGAQGSMCIFSLAPELPPQQQADTLLRGAQQLLARVRQLPGPLGGNLAAQATLHAGSYAGGVVGKGSWSYDLYGDEVSALMELDRLNTPNTIQASTEALRLMPGVRVTITPRTVALGCRTLWAHCLLLGDAPLASSSACAAQLQQPASASAPTPPVAPPPTPGRPPAPGARQGGAPRAAAAGEPPQLLDLRFLDPSLEAQYVQQQDQHHRWQDGLYALVSMVAAAAAAAAPPAALGLPPAAHNRLLRGPLPWLVPAAVLLLGATRPGLYQGWREVMLAWHRVLHTSMLCWALCVAAAAVPAADGGASDGAMALLRLACTGAWFDALGFKVRFSMQLRVATANAAALAVALAVSCATPGRLCTLSGALVPLLGIAALPSLFVYVWEHDTRARFAARRAAAAAQAHAPPAALKKLV